MTSDYLKSFTGRYNFDSGKLIDSNMHDSLYFMRDYYLQIQYDQELKSLLILFNGTPHRYLDTVAFVETDDQWVFYWLNGEGAGYTDFRYCFYKGGIVCNFDYSRYIMTDDGPSGSTYEHYIAYYKKVE